MMPRLQKPLRYNDLPREFQYYTDSEMSNSIEHPTPPPTLTRLEVESASTTSLPISFPYLYITENTNSFDTLNLLNQHNSNDGPKYPNTSHINATTPAGTGNGNPGTSAAPMTPSKNAGPSDQFKQTNPNKQPSDDSLFNQVPKRFSQFILDQQNPYMSQRLDNLSMVSPSLGSDDPRLTTRSNPKRSFSTNSKKTKMSSNSKPSTSQYTPFSNTLSQEISNSMGSQATIFSTRPEQELMGGASRMKSRRGRRSGIKTSTRFKRTKSSKVTSAQLYASNSSQMSLERRKAIRFKKGSILYRIKLRLDKFVAKMKSWKFHSFKVSSKRPGQSRNNSTKRKKSIRFAKSTYRNESKPLVISAPSTNPQLGRGEVERVKHLDDNLKYSAGAPKENVNILEPPSPEMGKLTHLSSFVDEQRTNYVNNITRRSDESSIDYRHNNILDPKRFEYQDGQTPELKLPKRMSYQERKPKDLKLPETLPQPEYEASETAESEAPPPPPHLVASLRSMSPTTPVTQIPPPNISPSAYESADVVELWRSYLSHVLCKRIQLRQEINLFQSFVVNRAVDSFDRPEEDLASVQGKIKSNIEQSHIETQSESSSTSSGPSEIYSTTDSEGTADVFVDPPAEEFNKTYLNRRSMLGEMLEYDSDGESDTSSVHTDFTTSRSVTQSDLSVVKTYGTVSRRKPATRMQSNSSMSSISTIRRSGAHQFDLHALSN